MTTTSPPYRGGTTVVFVGPTLDPGLARAAFAAADADIDLDLDLDLRGPVVCGDVLRAVDARVARIAIIDGFFDHHLPVWHKEILWALSRGVQVYGAASMGALRAAELAAFGMIGVGQIYAWFADGVLADDDEVAVAHDDGEGGYRPRSQAMVNLRATIDKAVQLDVVDATQAAQVIHNLKVLPYPVRSLRAPAAWMSIDPMARERLLAWVQEHGEIDQKRADALALLARLARDIRDPAAPLTAPFAFAYTEAFHQLVRTQAQASPPDNAPPPDDNAAPPDNAPPNDSDNDIDSADGVSLDDVLEELQLGDAIEFSACWQAASQHTDALPIVVPAILAALPQVLEERGSLAALLARAADKSARLGAVAAPAISVPRDQLVTSHFAAIGRAVPVDLARHARSLGFADAEAFVVAIARERWYQDALSGTGGPVRDD